MLLDWSLRRHFRYYYESSARLTSGLGNTRLSIASPQLSDTKRFSSKRGLLLIANTWKPWEIALSGHITLPAASMEICFMGFLFLAVVPAQTLHCYTQHTVILRQFKTGWAGQENPIYHHVERSLLFQNPLNVQHQGNFVGGGSSAQFPL